MGILDFARNLTYFAQCEAERLSRTRGQLDLKMEVFIAGYRGDVRCASIPSSSRHSPERYSNEGLFVCCYVRGEYKEGYTVFYWFQNLPDAARFAQELRNDPVCIKVIGPHNLPKENYERFY